jgi:hypothetical protein
LIQINRRSPRCWQFAADIRPDAAHLFMLMPFHDAIDFHVAALALGATSEWLVFRGDPAALAIVAFCSQRGDALERARTMAQYHCSIGRQSRVIAHDTADGSPRVAWQAAGKDDAEVPG